MHTSIREHKINESLLNVCTVILFISFDLYTADQKDWKTANNKDDKSNPMGFVWISQFCLVRILFHLTLIGASIPVSF